MPLKYNPHHARRWVPKSGTYTFVVTACEATTFKTGSEGVRVRLAVEAGGRVPMTVADNIVFSERTTWKMLALCRATGVRFDPPCEAHDLVGKTGTARFVTDERDGLVGLAVTRYLHSEPEAETGRG